MLMPALLDDIDIVPMVDHAEKLSLRQGVNILGAIVQRVYLDIIVKWLMQIISLQLKIS